MHSVQPSLAIPVSRASFTCTVGAQTDEVMGVECLLEHQGLVLCNCCLWTVVWDCQGPDPAAPAALNLSTSAGFGYMFELGPSFQRGCDLRFSLASTFTIR